MEDLDPDLFDEDFEECDECGESTFWCECDEECDLCGHGLIDPHLPGCPEGDD